MAEINLGSRTNNADYQSWADANVLASSRLRVPDAKAFLRREGRRRVTAENDAIAKDGTGHRREISRHWRQ